MTPEYQSGQLWHFESHQKNERLAIREILTGSFREPPASSLRIILQFLCSGKCAVHLWVLKNEIVIFDNMWNVFLWTYKLMFNSTCYWYFEKSQGLYWNMKLKCFHSFSADNLIFDFYFLIWISNTLILLAWWIIF